MRREYSIYQTLKGLAKQRVGMILNPGNTWVIEYALPDTERNQENLRTCHMRGWVDVLENSVPTGRVTKEGDLETRQVFSGRKPIYRLTDSGWNAIHRTHVQTLLGVIVALLGIVITINWGEAIAATMGLARQH